MWYLIGRFRCLACKALKTVDERARRSLYSRNFGVCRTCFETWERSGRKCVRCKGEVSEAQELAFFKDLESLGHYDCGGTRLA